MSLQQHTSVFVSAVGDISLALCFKNTLTAGHPVGFWFRWARRGVTGQHQWQTGTDHHRLNNLSWPNRSSYTSTEDVMTWKCKFDLNNIKLK